ncbi:stage II sporulation protein M [Salsuginibacillus kocurii]|uniref:stage II sporulation protein M n=1 Tax=Salsuginibacillus kocurii TaxID=427078 RepID=UPI000364FF09|nr:stage II sporulation protein M [Salsuginibacillus kocurii]
MKEDLLEAVRAHIGANRTTYVFTTVLFLMGVVFGSVMVNSLGLSHKHDLLMYVQQFFTQMSEQRVASSTDIFYQSLSQNVIYTGFMALLGLSVVGAPFILLILFIKGMVIGFTVGFLVQQMEVDGFLLAMVSIFPQNMITVPFFLFISVWSLSLSIKLVKRLFYNDQSDMLGSFIKKYVAAVLVTWIMIAVAALVEANLAPIMIRVVS